MTEKKSKASLTIEEVVAKLLAAEGQDTQESAWLQAMVRIGQGYALSYEEERVRMILVNLMEAIRIADNPEPRMLQYVQADIDLLDGAVDILRHELADMPEDEKRNLADVLHTLLYSSMRCRS